MIGKDLVLHLLKLQSLHFIHLNDVECSCSLSNLYEKLVVELPALNGFQRLSRPNVALQHAVNRQLLN